MIEVAILIALQAALPSGQITRTLDNQAGRLALQNYRACVLQAASKMERSNEQVALIADTAVGTCHEAREIAKERAIEWMTTKQSPVASDMADEAAEGAMKQFDSNFRADAFAALLIQRASRK